MFVLKRPDIGYHNGMTYIIGLLLSVFAQESEIFIVFSYLVEVVFPDDFFVADNRQLGLHKELRVAVKMAEVLRPKLMVTLIAVFKPNGGNVRETDTTPFILFIKQTVKIWIKSLFVPYLTLEDIYRVWDNIFIHGFEFILKFALILLSKHENFIKNSIKEETKNIGLGISVDSLIIAGNLARIKLFRKLERLPIEKLIKKAVTKNTYVALKRSSYLAGAIDLEKENLSRLIRLRQSKSLIAVKGLAYSSTYSLIKTMASISTQDQISRGLFGSIMSKEVDWEPRLSANVYITFDQLGQDTVKTKVISIGLAVLTDCSIEEKLMLCYLTNSVSNSGTVSIDSLCDTIIALEDALDCRSKLVKNNLSNVKNSLARYPAGVEMLNFVNIIMNDSVCEILIKLIQAIESSDVISSIEMNIANIAIEGDYSNTHSPMRMSGINSPKSDLSYEGPNVEELENRLDKLARSYTEKIEIEPFRVAFQFEDSECEGKFLCRCGSEK